MVYTTKHNFYKCRNIYLTQGANLNVGIAVGYRIRLLLLVVYILKQSSAKCCEHIVVPTGGIQDSGRPTRDTHCCSI